jgi:hypothetical protein
MLGLTSVALTVLFVFPASLPAAAQPPVTVAEAKDLIEQLQNDAAGIDQHYTGVKEQIKQGRAQLRLKVISERTRGGHFADMPLI